MIRDWRAQDYRLGNGDVRGSKEEVKNGLRLGREMSREIDGLGQRMGMVRVSHTCMECGF